MKTKTFITLFVTIVISFGITTGQNPFQLNGETIWESDGKLYRVTTSDTLKLDIRYITLEYEEGTDGSEISIIENGNHLTRVFISGSEKFVYKITSVH